MMRMHTKIYRRISRACREQDSIPFHPSGVPSYAISYQGLAALIPGYLSVAPPGQRRRSNIRSGAPSHATSYQGLAALIPGYLSVAPPGQRRRSTPPSGATASVYLSLRGNAVCLLLRGNGILPGAIGCRTGENFVLAGPEGLQIDSSGRSPENRNSGE